MLGRNTKYGFSLLELLVVLMLMSALTVTVLPQISKSGGTEVQSSARMLAAGLRRARSQAIQHRQPQSMIIDVEKRVFQLSFDPQPRKLPSGIGLSLFTARSALQSAERGAIRFFSDGGSTGGRITVSGSNQKLLVDVDWLTGQVRVLDSENPGVGAAGESLLGDKPRTAYTAARARVLKAS